MKQYTLIRETVDLDVINDRHVGRLDAVGIDAAGIVHEVTVPFRPDDGERDLAMRSLMSLASSLRLIPIDSEELAIAKGASIA